jgi:hypothetical protein
MTVMWDHVTRTDVLHAIQEYDRLGAEAFFTTHGFAPTSTYELVWDERRYPPKQSGPPRPPPLAAAPPAHSSLLRSIPARRP